MFSYALLDVLRNGDFSRSSQLSLRDIKELVEDRLAVLPEKNAPRPGLYSPDQSEGDAADVPFFPNPRAEEKQHSQADQSTITSQGRRIVMTIGVMPTVKVLFLDVDLTNTALLAIDEEIRAIVGRVRSAEYRDAFTFQTARLSHPEELSRCSTNIIRRSYMSATLAVGMG